MPGVAIGPADLALLPLPAQEEGLIWLQTAQGVSTDLTCT